MKELRYLFACVTLCVLAATIIGPVYAQDSLNIWSQNLSNNARVYAMAISATNGNLIYCAGLDSGVYKTTNAGVNWVPVNNGLTYNKVQAIAMSPSNNNILYCGTDQNGAANSGVYKTTDGGANWTLVSTGITDDKSIQVIAIHPTNPNIAWTTAFTGLTNSTIGLYKTTDGGANWFASNTGIGPVKNLLSIVVNPLNPNTLYCGTSFNLAPLTVGQSRVYKSTDGGATWVNMSNGWPTDSTIGHPIRALSMSTVDTNVILAASFLAADTLGGAYVTKNGGVSWIRKNNGLPSVNGALQRSCLIRPGSTTEFFVGFDAGGANQRGVWRTTNGGDNWFDFNNGAMVNTFTIRGLVFKTQGNPTLYAGGATATVPGRGVYEYSWAAPTPPPAVNRALLFPTPGVNTNYVQIPFQASMVGFGNNITIECWVKIGGSTTANTVLNKGAASFDYQLGINSTTIFPFFRAGATVVIDSFANLAVGVWAHLAVTYDGTTIKFYKDGVLHLSRAVALTLGSSTNEMRIGRGNNDPGSGYLDEMRLWSVARTQGQIDSTKCKKYPGSFTSTTGLKAVWHFDSTYVDSISNYVGTPIGTVAFDTVSLPCVPVSVAENKPPVPSDYELAQNYPNPFNPTTRIEFSLAEESNVRLRVYNILGQEVVTLANEQRSPGNHTVEWNGINTSGYRVTSGVYFYVFEAIPTSGRLTFTKVKKMIMLK